MALTAKQRAWAAAKLAGVSNLAASRAAGYAGDANCLAVIGSRNAHNPKIIAAIADKPRGEMAATLALILAIKTLGEIVRDPAHPDRYKAAGTLLELGLAHGIDPATASP